MTDFQLFPLPDRALEALRNSAVGTGVNGIAVVGSVPQVLRAPEVSTFVRELVRKERAFKPNLEGLFAIRKEKQAQIYANIHTNRQAMRFPVETREIRSGFWHSETIRPPNMADRSCENTHPSRAANMAIHALNSAAASDFMDNEDSQAPLKANVFAGYQTIHEAITGAIKDERPNSKTVLKGRLSPSDLFPVTSNDQAIAEATFKLLKEHKILNQHGRITDKLNETNRYTDQLPPNLPDAVDRQALDDLLRTRRPATIQVRVRGLHLMEGHVLVDDLPISGALLDYAVFVATCYGPLADICSQPTLYLPKMEGRQEAEWWAKIFQATSELMRIPLESIRSTTMIETITASMEKDEMNYALRKHSLGQNKGRYDYLFSFIKRLTLPKSEQRLLLKEALDKKNDNLIKHYRQFLLPDNAHTPMSTTFLDAYSNHTSQVNLKRGFDSVGGMVTSIPTGDPDIDGKAQQKVRKDKTEEAWKGDAGGWSGHPAFAPYVREPFDIVRGIHRGFQLLLKLVDRDRLVSSIKATEVSAAGAAGLEPLLQVIKEVQGSNGRALRDADSKVMQQLEQDLLRSLTLPVVADASKYIDGLLRFIDMNPPQPAVEDIELITVPLEQHEATKYTYAGLKQYLRLALYYTASYLHGTGCIALDGVFEDLATAEKARCNVWQWLTFDVPLLMLDGCTVTITPHIVLQALDEVYSVAMTSERALWGKVCKSATPMQPDTLEEKHFRVAKDILGILTTNDRCGEFIPDLAYPFLLDPVREDGDLWEELRQHLQTYCHPMTRYDEEVADLRGKLGIDKRLV